MAAREIVGQGSFEGIGEIRKIPLDQQQTFSGIAWPELWGVVPRALDETDYKDMQLVTPERLISSLVGVRATGESTVSYLSGEGGVINVALTPIEYGLIARNSMSLGRAAVNRTLASRPNRKDFGLDVDAAGRSGKHILKNYINKMEAYAEDTLSNDIKLLESFTEYSKHPELRRRRGDNYIMGMAWVREHIFGDTFMALRVQRDWTPEQENRARQALDSRLFLDRTNNRHLKNWSETLSFEREYWGYKWALFKTKTEEAKRQLKKYEQ